MRLFIAIDLPSELKDYLYNLEAELKSKLPGTIRFVSKKNLHLTLKFLGEINETKLDKMKIILSQIKSKEFEVSLEKISYFGTPKTIHTIWVSLKPEDEIIRLAQIIDQETLEFSSTEQKFSSHLTLGRVNKIKDTKKFREILEKEEIKHLKFKIPAFKLIQSTLTKDGPQYKILETYSLSGK